MSARTLLVVLLLLATFAPVVSAQTGWIEGRVTDGEKTIPYANILLSGTRVGVMGDAEGAFRFRAPCGRHTLRILAMGYGALDEPAIVRRGETTHVSVVMERVEVRQQEIVRPPWRRPAPQPGDEQQLESGPVNDVLEAIGRKAGVVGDWPYRISTDTVRQGDLEFSMRYTLAEQGDSVVVNLIAEGRNVSDRSVTVCGCFALWDTRYVHRGPASEPEPGTVLATLDVPPLECEGARFSGEAQTLRPGETMARGMAFSFYPNAFREHPGELWVYGVFLEGHHGDAWEDTDLIDLGEIRVPIRPIGMPIRP